MTFSKKLIFLIPQSLSKLSVIVHNLFLDLAVLRKCPQSNPQKCQTLLFNRGHHQQNSLTFNNCATICSRSIISIIMGKSKGGFYAVARGRQVGVYLTWNDCQTQVNGFGNARFKKFESKADAEQFIKDNNSGAASASSNFSRTLSMTIDGGVEKSKSAKTATSRITSIIPKSSSSTEVSVPSLSSQFPLATPSSRLQSKKTRTAILISPRPSLNNNNTIIGGKRGISTSAKLDKRALRVTEDRVTGAQPGRSNNNNPGLDLSTFQVDEEGYVVVFTDGACTKNGRKGAKAGIGVWFGDNHELNISEPVLGRQTNNTAEIQAAERAIAQAKDAGITKLKLKTDSQFTINCVTMWLNKWKRNNWKLGTGQNVKNREDLEKLDKAMNGVEIKWSYVQGHRGHYGNEQADQLAVAGANMSKN